jgi:hypothetical protein
MKNLRKARRFQLSFPVTIEASSKNKFELGIGKTLDISTRGVYFVLDNDLEVGMNLSLTMTLPTRPTEGTRVLIRATGRVLRVEKRGEDEVQNVGVAALIRRYEYLRYEAPDNSAEQLSSATGTQWDQ